ncbi:hypothetical protein M0R88_17725 [Halorussus gelatinilyticus]|uniref:Uncharacterized protein n=1 Tax=Halorussus gelatinilyticus TaxID=2937524 RepID=A0A8U0IHZ8_9EURY|nr:hypothetical protein [Halorussus gelatinilyticus]UPW00335.1 hypothetical protein M0R88_17725 [Halorussus gelatinilyticus]
MILWQTAKRWTYKGRKCEIQRTNVDDATQYRGLVEVETGLSDSALAAAPVAGLRRRNRPKRHEDGEYREWVYFERAGDAIADLREEVNGLAEHVRDAEV